jgi:hypothetical protein
MRKSAVDYVIELLKKKYPVKDWNRRDFDKLIENYKTRNSKGQFREFCNYVIWYLEKLKMSHQSR